METILELTEKEIIQENAEYVLGMYDMYGNDQEIVDMLKMKGLSNAIVQSVLIEVKKPAYIKRVKQAKVMIGISSVLLLVFLVLPYLFIHFTETATSTPPIQSESITANQTNASSSSGTVEGVLTVFALFLMRIGFYVILLGVSQLAIGTYLFFKYKKLLRNV